MRMLMRHGTSCSCLLPYRDSEALQKAVDVIKHGDAGLREQAGQKACGGSIFHKAGDGGYSGSKLSSSGALMTVCSHQHVLGICNLVKGEKYALVFGMMAKAVVDHGATRVYGDLMCKWQPFAKSLLDRLDGMDHDLPASIPLMTPQQLANLCVYLSGVHAMTHNWTCRVSAMASHVLCFRCWYIWLLACCCKHSEEWLSLDPAN
jgi:hypothetical protein